jgi:hypothetical protein
MDSENLRVFIGICFKNLEPDDIFEIVEKIYNRMSVQQDQERMGILVGFGYKFVQYSLDTFHSTIKDDSQITTHYLKEFLTEYSTNFLNHKIEDILQLYENKQISQFTTAKNLIKSFTSKDEKKIKKAEDSFKKHRETKQIDERMRQKYVRIEHKNIDKPQSSIKFRLSQQIPDLDDGLKTL